MQKTKCAKSSSEGFIVGGTKTELGEFPHMAAIGWQKDENSHIEWNCGGSLIRYTLLKFFKQDYRFYSLYSAIAMFFLLVIARHGVE